MNKYSWFTIKRNKNHSKSITNKISNYTRKDNTQKLIPELYNFIFKFNCS